MLDNPKYAGCSCWGRTSQRLSEGTKRLPRETWVLQRGAFPAIVDWNTFQRVQAILHNPCKYTDDEMLNALLRLWKEKGRLSEDIINRAADVPSASQYGRRFGSMRRAYQLIGYEQVVQLSTPEQRANSIKLRNDLISRILDRSYRNVVLVEARREAPPALDRQRQISGLHSSLPVSPHASRYDALGIPVGAKGGFGHEAGVLT
jgi:hypothetical protein